jgi:protein arginine N-methyltransferase 1
MRPYHLREHARMFANKSRNRAYARALECVVKSGDVVLDVGSGTGLLAMLACKAGASRVYAVESSSIVNYAKALAIHNGFAERITFFEQSSLMLTLPEPVDVIVSDIRGVLPFAANAVTSLIDARQRFLKPGGRMVPAQDIVYGAMVSAPVIYADFVEAWSGSAAGIDGTPLRNAATQQVTPVDADDLHVLGDAVPWAAIDYLTRDSSSASGRLRWHAIEPSDVSHGFALWFEAHLADGVAYRSGPGSGDDLYGAAFFPWPEPLSLAAGSVIDVDLRADLVSGSYVWTWRTAISTDGEPRTFNQSTFAGSPMSRATILEGS